jgi:hypothetical protein
MTILVIQCLCCLIMMPMTFLKSSVLFWFLMLRYVEINSDCVLIVFMACLLIDLGGMYVTLGFVFRLTKHAFILLRLLCSRVGDSCLRLKRLNCPLPSLMVHIGLRGFVVTRPLLHNLHWMVLTIHLPRYLKLSLILYIDFFSAFVAFVDVFSWIILMFLLSSQLQKGKMFVGEFPQSSVDGICNVEVGCEFEPGSTSHASLDGVCGLGDDTQCANVVDAQHLLFEFIGTPTNDDNDSVVDVDELISAKRNLDEALVDLVGLDTEPDAKVMRVKK